MRGSGPELGNGSRPQSGGTGSGGIARDDAGGDELGVLSRDLGRLVDGGVEDERGLRDDRRATGEDEAGRIREGGPADFTLVHGDPLSDPAAMWRVWRVA